MFGFWMIVVVMGVSSRLLTTTGVTQSGEYQLISSRGQFEPESITDVSVPRGRWSVWLAQHLTYPATFGYRCAQNVGWCTIPPRIQSFTILSFIVINVVFCIHGYRSFQDNV